MFRPDERHGKFLGFSMETDRAHFFFGSRELTRENINYFFPAYEFAFLKQVHGREIVAADPTQQLVADGHSTTRQGLALVAQTADCIPILLCSRSGVAAIHSGWRGCQQNIVAAMAQHLQNEPVQLAAIGPHILKESFEVGRDVAAALAVPDLELPHPNPTKVRIDLTEMVRRQLRLAFGPQLQILEALENTQTSPRFHSFRRDRERAGRQYSFVVLKR